jgi:hypothetical protein
MTLKCTVLLAFSGFMLMSPAFADINYELTSGGDTITFSLPELPAVQSSCALDSDCFSVSPVTLTVDGTVISGATVSFYTPADLGGLTILEGGVGSTVLVNNDGPNEEQLFTGTLANPTLETFSNLQLVKENAFGPQYNEAFLLNATSASGTAAPEPSYVVLLLVGVSVIAGMRLRKRVTVGA